MTDQQVQESDREYRAVAQDIGDARADVSPWFSSVADAAAIASDLATGAEPPYDEIWIERRIVEKPQRHITVRAAHPREETTDGT